MSVFALPNPPAGPPDPRDDPQAAAVLTTAFLRAGAFLGLKQIALARIVGVSAATVSRMPTRTLNPQGKDGELAALFLRLYRSLVSLYGGNAEQAAEWLAHEHDYFGAPPAQRIATAQGLVEVCAYLDAMRG